MNDLSGLLAMLLGGAIGAGLGSWVYLWMRERKRSVANPFLHQRRNPPQSPSARRTAPRDPMGM